MGMMGGWEVRNGDWLVVDQEKKKEEKIDGGRGIMQSCITSLSRGFGGRKDRMEMGDGD